MTDDSFFHPISYRDKAAYLDRLARDRRLSGNAFRLAYHIFAHLNHDTGRCDPSVTTLTDDTGLSREGVLRHIRKLEKLGLLACCRRTRPVKGQYGATYQQITGFRPLLTAPTEGTAPDDEIVARKRARKPRASAAQGADKPRKNPAQPAPSPDDDSVVLEPSDSKNLKGNDRVRRRTTAPVATVLQGLVDEVAPGTDVAAQPRSSVPGTATTPFQGLVRGDPAFSRWFDRVRHGGPGGRSDAWRRYQQHKEHVPEGHRPASMAEEHGHALALAAYLGERRAAQTGACLDGLPVDEPLCLEALLCSPAAAEQFSIDLELWLRYGVPLPEGPPLPEVPAWLALDHELLNVARLRAVAPAAFAAVVAAHRASTKAHAAEDAAAAGAATPGGEPDEELPCQPAS